GDTGITIGAEGGPSFFSGGISNLGTISANNIGILISNAGGPDSLTVSNGIYNAGWITGGTGIIVTNASLFGGIRNAGTINGTSGTAIDASTANSAIVINQQGGTIAGAIKLSAFADQVNITGGTIAGSIVGQGTDNITFALGHLGAFTYAAPFAITG